MAFLFFRPFGILYARTEISNPRQSTPRLNMFEALDSDRVVSAGIRNNGIRAVQKKHSPYAASLLKNMLIPSSLLFCRNPLSGRLILSAGTE